jgi:predicted HD phosphohydrolase
MAVQDRRHSIAVARRFVALAPTAPRPAVAGALLHDVGKQVAALGTLSRVVATVVGPRTERFRQYHDHEALGAAMLADAGSDPATVELVRAAGPWADTLRTADDI